MADEIARQHGIFNDTDTENGKARYWQIRKRHFKICWK